MEQIELIDLSG
jgi:hypothetical protein